MKEQPADRRPVAESAELAAALAGDHEAFRRLTDPYARELHLHCHRMLGSFHDAEDAMQETLLRAWRHLASFEGRSSLRAWLYRIATNVCLRHRARRRTDPLVVSRAAEAVAHSTEPAITLSPYPDTSLDEIEAATRTRARPRPWKAGGGRCATLGEEIATRGRRQRRMPGVQAGAPALTQGGVCGRR